MEEVLENHEELDQWFWNIKKWNKHDVFETKRA